MPSKTKRFPLTLLHVDASLFDRRLLQRALCSARGDFAPHGVATLQAATRYFGFLPGMNGSSSHPRPALIILDYALGAHCGADFLYWLRVRHRNTAIPVIMYSSSPSRDQVLQCYELGANHFLRKAQSVANTFRLALTLRLCFSWPTPRFDWLARLPESQPDPRITPPRLNLTTPQLSSANRPPLANATCILS